MWLILFVAGTPSKASVAAAPAAVAGTGFAKKERRGGLLYEMALNEKREEGIRATIQKVRTVREEQHLDPEAEALLIYWLDIWDF